MSGPCVTVTGPPQLSKAFTAESSGGGTCEAHDTVASAGQWVITGGLVSLTVIVCVQLAPLLQESVAVQIREMVLRQSVPLEVSLKLTATVPSQSSRAVTVGADGTWLRHW